MVKVTLKSSYDYVKNLVIFLMDKKLAVMIFLKKRKSEGHRMNIVILIVALVGGLAGLASTLYLVVSLIGVLVWKIYRKVVKGIPLYQ